MFKTMLIALEMNRGGERDQQVMMGTSDSERRIWLQECDTAVTKHQGGPGTLSQERAFHILVLTLHKCAEKLASIKGVAKMSFLELLELNQFCTEK